MPSTLGRILGRSRHAQTLLLQGMLGQRAGGWSSYRIISVSAKVGGVSLVNPESQWCRPYLPLTTAAVLYRYPVLGADCATWKQGTRVAGRLLGDYPEHHNSVGNSVGMYWVLPDSQHYRATLTVLPSRPARPAGYGVSRLHSRPAGPDPALGASENRS